MKKKELIRKYSTFQELRDISLIILATLLIRGTVNYFGNFFGLPNLGFDLVIILAIFLMLIGYIGMNHFLKVEGKLYSNKRLKGTIAPRYPFFIILFTLVIISLAMLTFGDSKAEFNFEGIVGAIAILLMFTWVIDEIYVKYLFWDVDRFLKWIRKIFS